MSTAQDPFPTHLEFPYDPSMTLDELLSLCSDSLGFIDFFNRTENE